MTREMPTRSLICLTEKPDAEKPNQWLAMSSSFDLLATVWSTQAMHSAKSFPVFLEKKDPYFFELSGVVDL